MRPIVEIFKSNEALLATFMILAIIGCITTTATVIDIFRVIVAIIMIKFVIKCLPLTPFSLNVMTGFTDISDFNNALDDKQNPSILTNKNMYHYYCAVTRNDSKGMNDALTANYRECSNKSFTCFKELCPHCTCTHIQEFSPEIYKKLDSPKIHA